MTRAHLVALNRTIKALDIEDNPRYAANIELSRTLARQMDQAMPEPGTRLVAAYLSAIKDLQKSAPTDVETDGQQPNKVIEFRRKLGIIP